MPQQVKVSFDLHGEPMDAESVWAEQVERNLYRLLNIPFYAIGYAKDDVVNCRRRRHSESDEEWNEVASIAQDSGNGTIRLLFADDAKSNSVQYILDELVSVGCSYERASATYAAVNVPHNLEIPFSQLASYLGSQPKNVLTAWEIAKAPIERDS